MINLLQVAHCLCIWWTLCQWLSFLWRKVCSRTHRTHIRWSVLWASVARFL